jgi:hypothetical protein
MELRKALIDKGLYEVLPYVKSLYLKRRYMLLSYALVDNAEKQLINRMQSIKDEKEFELETLGHTAWGTKDRDRWNVSIDGLTVDIVDYVGKNVWEFFHYARICLDMIPQILNITAFDQNNRSKPDDVNIKRLIKSLPEHYAKIRELLKSFQNNECYKYIQSIDDYLKHIDSVGIKIQTKNWMEDFDSFIIGDFVFRRKNYSKREIQQLLQETKGFVLNAIDQFFDELLDASKESDFENRITDVAYECLMKGRITEYMVFFVDIESPETLKSFKDRGIYIHPLIVGNDYHIYDDSTFAFDTIFIRQKQTQNILGVAHLDADSVQSFYKHYYVEPASEDDYSDFITKFKENYKRIRVKNILAFQGIERRLPVTEIQ